jgi:hypothetical protein
VPRGAKRVALALLTFASLYAFFASTFDFRNLTDTDLNSRQTEQLVRHGNVDLSAQKLLPAEFAFHHDGHVYSEFGVGISVIAAPLYFVPIHLGASRAFMAGGAAIAFVTGAALVLHRVLLRLVPSSLAGPSAMVFAAGTPMWPVATTALHEASGVALAQAAGLAGLFSDTRWGPLLAGAGFGAATFVRPTEAVVVGLVGLFFLVRERARFLPFVAGAAVPVAGLIIQNRWLWGNWWTGGYANNPQGFRGDVPSALFGLMFGWWRGLLVYTPVLILGFIGWYVAMRRPRGFVEERMILLGVVSIAMIGLYARWTEWWGGTNQYGYRFLLEIVAFLVVLGAFAVHRVPRLRAPAAALAVLSVLNMAFGMQPNRFAWDGVKFPHRFADAPIGQAWIVFVHHPGGSILRLVGVVAVTGLLVFAGQHVMRGRRVPLEAGIA